MICLKRRSLTHNLLNVPGVTKIRCFGSALCVPVTIYNIRLTLMMTS